ncbi:MAG: N-acetylmuramoyl-L-alanine amidase, partial [Elusimicrobia bacterium]|nr:N-acetylmuramoyl-L-alanine amidase [Elusimicrobiota bacterium]
EIYFLSEKASDPQAAAVARFENSVIELESRSPKERKTVEPLLRSLVRTDNINVSSELCGVIARQVEQRGVTENRGVRQAGFYVLRGTEMPAALVELSFLSNPRDERNLRNRRFRKRMIEALLAGVREFEGRLSVREAPSP